jgi:GNAT superfamily N-acetyltransferase
MIEGEAWLSSRPRPLLLCRPTNLPVPEVTLNDVEIRTIDARSDHSDIAKLLMNVWIDEEPYRCLEDPEAALQAQIQRSLEDPGLGVIAYGEQGVCAAVLVPSTAVPALMWLTVRRDARQRWLATALLRAVVETLSAHGTNELATAVSATNLPSLRWHLTRGFQLAPDPLKEA